MTHQNDDISKTKEAQDTTHDRIRREVIFVETEDANDEGAEEEDEQDDEESVPKKPEREEKPWMIFTTGSILTDGTLPYHRYFIAIAAMCFLSIFLTFMSLNADREYRLREKYASVLKERAVLKEEERYGLSSKNAVQKRLREHGIELIDLSNDSRLIERK